MNHLILYRGIDHAGLNIIHLITSISVIDVATYIVSLECGIFTYLDGHRYKKSRAQDIESYLDPSWYQLSESIENTLL